jgi:hypothetical protein
VGFLSPLFLLGMLAIAIPIALHLFRHHAGPVQPFSAVRFLQRAPLQRARRRRLRDLLLLALRVTALGLLAVSFARPYVTTTDAESSAPITIVAIDRSFSLSAPGQAERARALATEVVDGLPAGERIAVMAFDERAELLVPPTGGRAEARRAIATVAPGHAATRYGAALTAAGEIAGSRRARLVIVSDLQRGGWSGARTTVPSELEIDARAVEPPAGNLWVGEVSRTAEGIVASVHNSADAPRRPQVSLQLDGRVSATQEPVIPARDAVRVTFAGAWPDRGAVAVSVQDGEGYAADNVRYAVLDPPVRRRVLLVVGAGGDGSEAFYLHRAVAAAAGPAGLAVETTAADRVARADANLGAYAAVVLLGSRGLDARAANALAKELDRGCGLLVVAGPDMDWPWLASQLPPSLGIRPARVESIPSALSFAPADVRHPVFQAFGTGGALSDIRFTRVLRLSVPSGARVLAAFADGTPALVELEESPGRTLVFTSDLANQWNDFAVHAAFVPFVHELVRYVAAERPARRNVYVGAGRGPEWARPGVVVDRREGRVAVNVDSRESDRAVMTPAQFLETVPRAPRERFDGAAAYARTRESEQSLWRYGLLVMLIGLLAESVIGRQR